MRRAAQKQDGKKITDVPTNTFFHHNSAGQKRKIHDDPVLKEDGNEANSPDNLDVKEINKYDSQDGWETVEVIDESLPIMMKHATP